MKKFAVIITMCLVFTSLSAAPYISWDRLKDENTYEDPNFNSDLARAVVTLLMQEEVTTVAGMGCGSVDYVRKFLNMGFQAVGYENDPDIEEKSDGIVLPMILTEEFNLGQQFEWIISLEAKDCLTRVHSETFVRNLTTHSAKGVMISTCSSSKNGTDLHSRKSKYISHLFKNQGFTRDNAAEKRLKKADNRTLVMVFRRGEQ